MQHDVHNQKQKQDVPYRAILERFLMSGEFAPAIIASTRAGFGGSGYTVELFPDGHWRVLWDNSIGNLYDSPGELLAVPKMSDTDWNDLLELVNSDHPEHLTIEEENTAMAQQLLYSVGDTLTDIADEMRSMLIA